MTKLLTFLLSTFIQTFFDWLYCMLHCSLLINFDKFTFQYEVGSLPASQLASHARIFYLGSGPPLRSFQVPYRALQGKIIFIFIYFLFFLPFLSFFFASFFTFSHPLGTLLGPSWAPLALPGRPGYPGPPRPSQALPGPLGHPLGAPAAPSRGPCGTLPGLPGPHNKVPGYTPSQRSCLREKALVQKLK
jgi:hypothetical protein